jgi:hypothetical protein
MEREAAQKDQSERRDLSRPLPMAQPGISNSKRRDRRRS